MRKAWLAMTGTAIVLLTACPYHGRVPIGPVQQGLLDERLLGEWESGSTDEFMPRRLWIARFNDAEYVVTGIGSCPDPGGRGYVTRLGEHLFLNVKEEGEGRYRIARVDFDGPQLVLRQLTDSLDEVPTTDSLRARVLARIEDAATYDGAVSYRKTGNAVTDTGAAALAWIPRACPYEGKVLLENAEPDSVLHFLAGRWRAGVQDTLILDVSRSAGGRARIAYPTGLRDERTDVVSVYATRIGAALFLNMTEGNGESSGVARIRLNGDTLELRMLNAGIRAESPSALRRVLTERLEDPGIYYWQPFRLVRMR